MKYTRKRNTRKNHTRKMRQWGGKIPHVKMGESFDYFPYDTHNIIFNGQLIVPHKENADWFEMTSNFELKRIKENEIESVLSLISDYDVSPEIYDKRLPIIDNEKYDIDLSYMNTFLTLLNPTANEIISQMCKFISDRNSKSYEYLSKSLFRIDEHYNYVELQPSLNLFNKFSFANKLRELLELLIDFSKKFTEETVIQIFGSKEAYLNLHDATQVFYRYTSSKNNLINATTKSQLPEDTNDIKPLVNSVMNTALKKRGAKAVDLIDFASCMVKDNKELNMFRDLLKIIETFELKKNKTSYYFGVSPCSFFLIFLIHNRMCKPYFSYDSRKYLYPISRLNLYKNLTRENYSVSNNVYSIFFTYPKITDYAVSYDGKSYSACVERALFELIKFMAYDDDSKTFDANDLAAYFNEKLSEEQKTRIMQIFTGSVDDIKKYDQEKFILFCKLLSDVTPLQNFRIQEQIYNIRSTTFHSTFLSFFSETAGSKKNGLMDYIFKYMKKKESKLELSIKGMLIIFTNYSYHTSVSYRNATTDILLLTDYFVLDISIKPKDLRKISDVNVKYVTNMHSYFEGFRADKLDLSKWDLRNVKNKDVDEDYEGINLMFVNTNIDTLIMTNMLPRGCYLASLFLRSKINNLIWNDLNCYDNRLIPRYLFKEKTFNKIICDNWKMNTMENMFIECKINEPLDLSSWNVENVCDADNMFKKAKIPELNVSNWKWAKQTCSYGNGICMQGLFKESDIGIIHAQNWDFKNVSNTKEMFYNAKNITDDVLETWTNTKNVNKIDGMFVGYKGLTEKSLLKFYDEL